MTNAKNKRKLAIFVEDILYFGGAEKYSVELGMRMKNFEFACFTFPRNKIMRISLDKAEHILKGRLVFFSYLGRKNSKVGYKPVCMLKMVRMLSNYDSIYIADSSLHTLIPVVIASALYKKRCVFGMHDPAIFRATKTRKSMPYKIIERAYDRIRQYFIMHIPYIQVLNNSDESMLKAQGYEGRIYHITPFIYDKPKIKQIKVNKNFNALFVGRLDIQHKGLDFLCKIIDSALEKNKDITFHIVGSGKEGEKLIKEAENKHKGNVVFHGFLDEKRLNGMYRNSDLLLVTSRYEGFPATILEAQNWGLPFIAFDVKGPKEALSSSIQGTIIKAFDTEEYAKEIIRYFEKWKDKENYIKAKLEIVSIINKNYGEKVIMPKMEQMLGGDFDKEDA